MEVPRNIRQNLRFDLLVVNGRTEFFMQLGDKEIQVVIRADQSFGPTDGLYVQSSASSPEEGARCCFRMDNWLVEQFQLFRIPPPQNVEAIFAGMPSAQGALLAVDNFWGEWL